jgi:hypothetical protein
MTLFSPTVLYPPIATHDRLSFSGEIAFGVWASVILLGLAMLSAALGVAPLADPVIFLGS